jgi:Ca2+-transporting ATPase
VQADAALLEATNLPVNEPLLTGASVPVRKSAGDESAAWGRPSGDDQPFVCSGTVVSQG